MSITASDDVTVDVFKGKIGGGIGLGPGGAKAMVEAGVDFVATEIALWKNQCLNANFGLNADTGGEFGVDGVNLKAAGLGLSLGRTMGIYTPFGGVNLTLW